LKEAVTAFREALKEPALPNSGAIIQINLGTALQLLGAREENREYLGAAVTAYRAALQEMTRQQRPLVWAETQSKLAATLYKLGEHDSDTARMEEAIVAYGEALKEYIPESMAVQWATTTGNQGMALRDVAFRRRDLAMAERAISQITNAVERCRRVNYMQCVDYFQKQLPPAQALAERLRKG